MSTENVKIETATLNKIRKIVKVTKQSIGGVITIAADAYAEKELKKLKIK